MLRRTPCVGICSTTYGDLVCRGCKRFAHEIVQWNGFDEEQRQAIRQRLAALRAGAVRAVLDLVDEGRLRQGARALAIVDAGSLDAPSLAYEVLQRLEGHDRPTPSELGLAPAEPASELLRRIDREFYQRSLAHYERNYRIPAQ